MVNLIVLKSIYSALGYYREIFTHKSRPDGEEKNKQFPKVVSIKSATEKKVNCLNVLALSLLKTHGYL